MSFVLEVKGAMSTNRIYRGIRSTARRGFTLIEAAIVTAIVGFGIVGVLQLMTAGTMANIDSADLTTAMGLASNIHERALGVKYDQMFTQFNDKTYPSGAITGPIDAKGN